MDKSESSPTPSFLEINSMKVVDAIDVYLKELVADHKTIGVCLGLSGGIDSAVLASIAAHSFGNAAVHALYLFDRDSSEELRKNAILVSDTLGIPLEVESIDKEPHRESGAIGYRFRNQFLAPRLYRSLHLLYRFLFKESPFESSLWLGNPDPTVLENRNPRFRTLIEPFAESINKRHIHRRKILEKKAKSENLLVLGAANRTEWLTGWFVKDGIDDVPIQPLKGLYKTQVRQLARFQDLPRQVIDQPPSPDMILGITDEFGLGMSYWKIDLALDHLAGGLVMSDLLHQGVSEGELNRVNQLIRLSGWKRDPHSPKPPVNGTLQGGIRIDQTKGEQYKMVD